MSGKITGISGPVVTTDMQGLKLNEKVSVGCGKLTGEAIRIEKAQAVIQVYEDTRGVGLHEPVTATGMPLHVRLGPGMLSEMYDGLQRPLERLLAEQGPFLIAGKEVDVLDYSRTWKHVPLKSEGDTLLQGEFFGYVEEGSFRHYLACHTPGQSSRGDGKRLSKRRIASIKEGTFTLGEPLGTLDDGTEFFAWHDWPVRIPKPFKKKVTSNEPLITGQRSIDLMFPIARGGTAVMPGGFGTGKTVLEQSIAKYADVDIVIYVGCGERGNEMADLIEEFRVLSDPWASKPLMERTVLVVNTSNMPVAAREASIYTAVTIAEYYRDMGFHVLLLADSLSRWAEAMREISASLEEMPGEEGYPTYLSSRLAGFFERAGVVETISGRNGSLTMILSVSPAGADFTEPVTQACLRATGASLILDTSLAYSRHYPAINWNQSYSLYTTELSEYFKEKVAEQWPALQVRCREILQKEESLKEVIEIIGVSGLQDDDRLLITIAEKIRTELLSQNAFSDDAFSPPEKTFSIMERIIRFYDMAESRLKNGEPLEDVLKEGGTAV